ncbi:MAG: hypothetical protein HOB22_07855 [Candidatus Marinimicrobia bacterium]|nr:hypothetical protein [Candidatus Neomarinimicrobiota bacterium]
MSKVYSKQSSKNNTKSYTESNMASKLIYDVKGKVGGVEKSYWEMSDAEIGELMKTERFSLTCAPGGENNRGMEIIGRMPIKGEGFTAKDIEGLGPYFDRLMPPIMDEANQLCFPKVSVLNLNVLSMDDTVDDLCEEDQARVIILRDWAASSMGAHGWTKEVFKELASIRWDAEYLDPNKYRTEVVNGEEVKVRGRPMTKRARTNLCFVSGREQEPAVLEGKGSIYDLKKMDLLNKGVEMLKKQIDEGLIEIGSKTKVEINVVEGNRYYNLKNTGIGFHGDTERVVVICISIGCDNYPMRWQWFKDGMPVGKHIGITLNCGDVYIMSEKAVGADWKKKSKYTLRHSAGAKKYTSLSKWEKKRPAYVKKVSDKAKVKAKKETDKAEKLAARQQAKLEKEKKQKAVPKLKPLKKVDPEVMAIRKYKAALRKHDWNDADAGFYRWVAIEAEHDISPNSDYFKEFGAVWCGKAENYVQKMNSKEWEEQRAFYRNLCAYGSLW